MKKVTRILLSGILLVLLVGITRQVVFGEEIGMENNVGIGFDNSYEPTSSSEPQPTPVPKSVPTPKSVSRPAAKGISKRLPQTGEEKSSSVSWGGLLMVVVVISRLQQKKNK